MNHKEQQIKAVDEIEQRAVEAPYEAAPAPVDAPLVAAPGPVDAPLVAAPGTPVEAPSVAAPGFGEAPLVAALLEIDARFAALSPEVALTVASVVGNAPREETGAALSFTGLPSATRAPNRRALASATPGIAVPLPLIRPGMSDAALRRAFKLATAATTSLQIDNLPD